MATKDIPDTMVCQAVLEAEGNFHGGNLIDRLMEKSGECEKVCYAAAHRSAGRGYIEYGVSVRVPWLTDKGRDLLATEVAR